MYVLRDPRAGCQESYVSVWGLKSRCPQAPAPHRPRDNVFWAFCSLAELWDSWLRASPSPRAQGSLAACPRLSRTPTLCLPLTRTQITQDNIPLSGALT